MPLLGRLPYRGLWLPGPLLGREIIVRPGWNAAAHTDAEVLHAAAYYKLKTHVEGLLQQGQTAKAVRLWPSVCQIDHFPPHPISLGVEGLPPSREHPAWLHTVDCRRCSEFLAGFKFPWIGARNGSAVLALPGRDPRYAWQSYYARLDEAQLDLLLIELVRTHGQGETLCRTTSMACRSHRNA